MAMKKQKRPSDYGQEQAADPASLKPVPQLSAAGPNSAAAPPENQLPHGEGGVADIVTPTADSAIPAAGNNELNAGDLADKRTLTPQSEIGHAKRRAPHEGSNNAQALSHPQTPQARPKRESPANPDVPMEDQQDRQYLLLQFGKFVQDTYSDGFYLALSLVQNSDAVLDILQDSYIAVFKRFGTIRRLKSYFLRTVGNKARNWRRNKRRNVVLVDDEFFQEIKPITAATLPPADEIEIAEKKKLIREAVDRLPPKYRQVVKLHSWQWLPFDEVGKILGIPESTATSRFHKALELLAAELSRDFKNPTDL